MNSGTSPKVAFSSDPAPATQERKQHSGNGLAIASLSIAAIVLGGIAFKKGAGLSQAVKRAEAAEKTLADITAKAVAEAEKIAAKDAAKAARRAEIKAMVTPYKPSDKEVAMVKEFKHSEHMKFVAQVDDEIIQASERTSKKGHAQRANDIKEALKQEKIDIKTHADRQAQIEGAFADIEKTQAEKFAAFKKNSDISKLASEQRVASTNSLVSEMEQVEKNVTKKAHNAKQKEITQAFADKDAADKAIVKAGVGSIINSLQQPIKKIV